MSQPAVRQEQTPANDSAYDQESVGQESLGRETGEWQTDGPGEEESETKSPPSLRMADNPVRRAIEEFRALIDEMDDLRELLRAHGIPLRTTRMIVEFGIQKKPDKQSMAIDSAMEQARQSFGEGCLERSVLENHISTIVNLERDLSHARSVAREEGLDAQALSMLTQMVQQNPGDGGAKAVNTFLGYALAYGIKTDQLAEIAGELTRRQASVLPQIPRIVRTDTDPPASRVIKDMLMGLCIGIAVIWVLL